MENATKSYTSWEFTIMDHGPCGSVASGWVQVMKELFLLPITYTKKLDVLCKQKLASHCCLIYAHNNDETSGHIVSIILAIALAMNMIYSILYSSAHQWLSCAWPITVSWLLPAWGLIIIFTGHCTENQVKVNPHNCSFTATTVSFFFKTGVIYHFHLIKFC